MLFDRREVQRLAKRLAPMSEVARVHSDAATARARIDRIAAHVDPASRQDIIDAHRERDWLALGYATGTNCAIPSFAAP